MKKKLLHIGTLLFLSVTSVLFLFNSLLAGDIKNFLPLKISPEIQIENFAPQQKNIYSPQELQRIYMFEHIHKSVERGKKGISC
ncbi:hypothetical protein [uncultured Cytophaga sp.]|uniref:hypothetical protein n=1 Tax=uncultured Cytophaga sp. TaxID=160238 RepID=UPI002635AD56|nr:hypothetical protein [uncultured Cytophaga sp.]